MTTGIKRAKYGESVGEHSVFRKKRKGIIQDLWKEGMPPAALATVIGISENSINKLCHGLPQPPLRPIHRNVTFPVPEVRPGCGYSVIVERARLTLNEYAVINALYKQAEDDKGSSFN